jgi:hypothetical protein
VTIRDLLDDSKWELNDYKSPIFLGAPYVVWGLTAYLLRKFLRDIVGQCEIIT